MGRARRDGAVRRGLRSAAGPHPRDHQAVDRLGRDLRAVAWADDGIVEAIEGEGEALYLGVQWHIETLTHLPRHARVFEALVEAARVAPAYAG